MNSAVAAVLLLPFCTLESQPPRPERFPDNFDQLYSAVELSANRTLITERGEQRPLIVDWSSGTRVPIGFVGRGPREFQGPRRMYPLRSGTAAIEDPYRAAVFPFVDGKVQESLSLRLASREYSQRIFAGADTSGRFLFISVARQGKTLGMRVRFNATELVAVVGTSGQSKLDTIARLRGSFRAETSVFRVNLGRRLEYQHHSLLVTEEQALMFPDGWIAILRKDPYRLEWRDPEGTWRRGPVASDSVVPVTVDERRYALYRHATALQRPTFKIEEFPNWPTTMPAFPLDAMLPLPDGRVAVRRIPTARVRIEWVDVFDRYGRRVDRWRLPPEHQLIGVGARWIYLTNRDDEDLFSLSRLKRPP